MAVADLTRQSRAGVSPAQAVRTIPVLALGMSASLFFVISYLICVLGYLLFPALPIEHAALAIFLPGFELLSWGTFFLGLVESFAYGWYIAVIFGPLYNFFALRWH
jgi:uncharacterized protein DUF5676